MAETEYSDVYGYAVIILGEAVGFVVIEGGFGEEQIYVLIAFIGQMDSTNYAF